MADKPSAQADLAKVVDSLFATIEPYRSRGHLEVEWRLCTFGSLAPQAPPPPPPRSASAADSAAAKAHTVVVPRLLRSREKITVGVDERDFDRIEQYVKEAIVTDACPLTVSCTEDVQDGRRRNTFTVEPDGKKVPTVSISKKRLCVVDMALPGCPYDLRLSVSTEDEAQTSLATTAPDTAGQSDSASRPKSLFSRLKRRQSVHCDDAAVCYDLTRVVNSHQHKSFEVELEGNFKDPKTELTRTWVQNALDRMVTLATLDGVRGTRTQLALCRTLKRSHCATEN